MSNHEESGPFAPLERGVEAQFFCDMSALSEEQRLRVMPLLARVRAAVRRVEELPDGYTFHLPSDAPTLDAVTEYVKLERLCCPFFRFRLEIEPAGGPVRLSLTGPAGVKPFIKDELGL